MTRIASLAIPFAGTFVGALFVLLGALAFVACDDVGIVVPDCGVIPEAGCPVGRGDPCLDRTCRAAYQCETSGTWREVRTCDGYVPTADVDGAAGAGAEAKDAQVIDAPPGAYGGPGCPSLEAPDCLLGTVLACGGGCCGCEDTFVCRDGAWDFAGACVDGGVRLSSP